MSFNYLEKIKGTASENNPVGKLKEDMPCTVFGYTVDARDETKTELHIKKGEQILMMGCSHLVTESGALYGIFEYDNKYHIKLKLDVVQFDKPYKILTQLTE